MANTKLEAFEEALRADEALRTRYEETLRSVAEAGVVASDGEAIQRAAAVLGFELSLEELEQAWAAAQELDVTELDTVAGGGHEEHDRFCLAAWFCFTALRHTEVECPDVVEDSGIEELIAAYHPEACWSNYRCIFVNK